MQSLPLAAEEADATSWEDQAALARVLLGELQAEQQGWPTTAEQDSALLAGVEGGSGGAGLDERLAAAVQYRLQRKLLVGAAAGLLWRFLDS